MFSFNFFSAYSLNLSLPRAELILKTLTFFENNIVFIYRMIKSIELNPSSFEVTKDKLEHLKKLVKKVDTLVISSRLFYVSTTFLKVLYSS